MTAAGWAARSTAPSWMVESGDPVLMASAEAWELEHLRNQAEDKAEQRRTEQRRQDARDQHDDLTTRAAVGLYEPRTHAEIIAGASAAMDRDDHLAERERTRELRDLPSRAESLADTAASMERNLANVMSRESRYMRELARRR